MGDGLYGAQGSRNVTVLYRPDALIAGVGTLDMVEVIAQGLSEGVLGQNDSLVFSLVRNMGKDRRSDNRVSLSDTSQEAVRHPSSKDLGPTGTNSPYWSTQEVLSYKMEGSILD